MICEHVEIGGVQITGKCIYESKRETSHFPSCTPGKTCPQVLFIPLGRKGEDYEVNNRLRNWFCK